MPVILIAASVAIVLADVWLIVACWRRQAVLAGLCATIAVSLLVVAYVSGLHTRSATNAIAGSGVSVVIGVLLFVLGQAVQRLLDA